MRAGPENMGVGRTLKHSMLTQGAMSNPKASMRASGWGGIPTFPTAASPSSTSLTLLLGFGCEDASAMAARYRYAPQ